MHVDCSESEKIREAQRRTKGQPYVPRLFTRKIRLLQLYHKGSGQGRVALEWSKPGSVLKHCTDKKKLLREISQTKKDSTVWFYLNVESQKQNKSRLTDAENKLMAVKGKGMERRVKMLKVLRVWTSNYKTNYSQEIINNVISFYDARWLLGLSWWSLRKLLGHCAVHLKLTWCCMSTILNNKLIN